MAASFAYPFAVYFSDGRISPPVFVAAALALVGLRLATLRAPEAKRWRLPMAGAAVALVFLALIDLSFAAKAYPVLLGLAAAGLFGWSLLRPPSLIERFARIKRPDLPATAQAYCRCVTIVWTIWLFSNAAVAAALAAWGSVTMWTVWTGIVFYGVSAALFVGEFGLRRLLRQGRMGL